MFSIFSQKCGGDNAYFGEEINGNGQFKNNACCQGKNGNSRNIRIHGDHIGNLIAYSVVSQKVDRHGGNDIITKEHAQGKKEGGIKNDSAGISFFIVVECRLDKAPKFPNDIRKGYDYAGQKGHPHVQGKLCRKFGTDQIEMNFGDAHVQVKLLGKHAKHSIGPEIGFFGGKDDSIEKKFFEEKSDDRDDKNSHYRPYQMPPQGF